MTLDPNFQSVLLGVVANCVSGFIAQSGRWLGGVFSESEQSSTDLKEILKEAIERASDDLEWEHDLPVEEVCLFIQSPEVADMMRQIFSVRLLDQNEPKHLSMIREEFALSFARFLGNRDSLTEAAPGLFELLLHVCDNWLSTCIDGGKLAAHEAKSTGRFRILLDELDAIQKNITLLQGNPDIEAILDFQTAYNSQVTARHWYIVPPHLDVARKIAIDDLYVCPHFVVKASHRTQVDSQVSMEELLGSMYRTVLLGNPGGGKSTFAQKLCHDLADQSANCKIGGRMVTPVLVVLRDYGRQKKDHGCSIIEFVEQTAKSHYQISPPDGAFNYLLLRGRTAVIFDGLDELLDTNYRQEITADVESFCNLYPTVPVLVTSREVGYEQAPLDERKFEVVRLAPFTEGQVNEYARKWFALEQELVFELREQKAKAFVDESRVVPDLRSNPLMLALMCNIYRGESYIPRNRPDVYEKCATMLFDRWDKSRGIDVLLPFESHIRPAMMFLAHWIYTDSALQGGVSEEMLVNKASEYLHEWRFDDVYEAKRAARDFVQFCRGRAWVFTETGTTKQGERLYQFTHRTFLEYFTAQHIVQTHASPSKLITLLRPRIARQEWDMVAQLSFQILNKTVQGAGDELLQRLVGFGGGALKESKSYMLVFALRCLEFITPRPSTTRAVIIECLDRCYEYGLHCQETPTEEKLPSAAHHKIIEIIRQIQEGLISVSLDNRKATFSAISSWLISIMESDLPGALLGAEILISLDSSASVRATNGSNDGWEEISAQIYVTVASRLQNLAQLYISIAIAMYWRKRISVKDLVLWHTPSGLFESGRFTIFPGAWLSVADGLSLNMMSSMRIGISENEKQSPTIDFYNRMQQDLEYISDVLTSTPPPWTARPRAVGPHFWLWEFTETDEAALHACTEQIKSSSVAFPIFALVATLFEVQPDKRALDAQLKAIRERKTPFSVLAPLWMRRFGISSAEEAEAVLSGIEVVPEQREIIEKWMNGKVSFVRS
jgi:hypothetical protein